MAYTSTEIAPVTPPAAPVAPTLTEYKAPDVTATKPTINTANTGYVAPTSSYTAKNVDTGLLEYDPAKGNNLTFDGRQINAGAVGANVSNTTPTFAEGKSYLSDGAFVENRVNAIASDPNNELMKRQSAIGLAEAGTRGLQNTTMGATIGRTAVLDKALQIATPDATTQATADMSRQNATYASQQAQQNAQNQGTLAEQTAKINSALAAQTAGQSWDAVGQKAVIQGDLNIQGAKIANAQANQAAEIANDARAQQGLLEGAGKTQAANISAELAGMESVSAQNLSILQNKLESAGRTTQEQNAATMQAFTAQQDLIKTQLSATYDQVKSQANLNAAQRDSLSGAMTTMANNYEISVQGIMLDPNLTAASKDAAIIRINKLFNQDMANIASVFGATYANTNSGA
jgi:hypothetical protein